MELDKFSIIMGAVFLVLMFWPVYYFDRLGKKRLARGKNEIKRIEKENKLKFSQQETWCDKSLGLDTERKYLLFLNLLRNKETKLLIDLTYAIKCRNIQSKDMVQLIIDKENGHSEMPEVIVLFDNNVDAPMDLGFHKVTANKWAAFINDMIGQNQRRPKKAA